MKISLIQMDVRLGEPDFNFAHAEELVRRAVATEHPDVVTLPEAWNVGFFPKGHLEELADQNGARVKQVFGALAKELSVNIIAGSVANLRDSALYNTSFVFDRSGNLVAEYDKTHLFTPSGEHRFFTLGNHVVDFTLDGVHCGLVICYDIRFVELVRTLALRGIDLLFVVAQWPEMRGFHWDTLNRARAIENQIFVACTNASGTAGKIKNAGHSALIDPWGETLVMGHDTECILTAEADLSVVQNIRNSINAYRDRRPELYEITRKQKN
ncbi:carbon-nitrogen family hydrolase [Pygmaiobacter massiliensis]|uniref:carbon-nitrogen family hydrolase n=1 Tax=Pygmaiobacter massiliensis TaxID=1917873 RepID=UPI002A825BEE|nr:carbon-nitrogen family hydrolase [Pygmaiobacter massiliensis]MDY4784999.1 carbon-nitrogen family hydrolase [Pygmaiobacter massiliensis]